MKSILTKRQVKTFSKDLPNNHKIYVNVRYDDECGNGHNSFAITGDIYSSRTSKADRYFEMGGCIHEQVAKHFPELAPFIKWHLTSSDGPMHYVANTMYHARTCDTKGKKPGDPIAFKEYLQFGNFPMTFSEPEKGFFEFLRGCKSDFSDLVIEPIEYVNRPGNHYDFEPKYTFQGFANDWYKCPFDSGKEAHEWLEALQQYGAKFIKKPCKWAQAVEPDLEAARSCAIWPDATLEQLQDEKLLAARLPSLLAEFKKDIESLGFVY